MAKTGQFEISIGIDPSCGKWAALLRFPDGQILSTEKWYNTRAELEREINEWLDEHGIVIDSKESMH